MSIGRLNDIHRLGPRLFALYHDVSELVTGDLPTPVKYYNDDILKSYREIEEHAKEQILKKLPSELYDEYFDIINENCSGTMRVSFLCPP